MDHRETTLKRNVIFTGKIITVRKDDALLPNGRPCTREVVEHPGGASVVLVLSGRIALVRQFRYAYGEELLEIPAGKLERGEDPMLAAMRELEEETGYAAGKMEPLFTVYPTPGYCDEKIYIYRALDVSTGRRHPDEDEFLDVTMVPLEEAYAMVERGEIRDSKTIIALQFLRLQGAV